MTIERAAELAADEPLRADVCVIGSGAAGITIARLLDGSPLRVVLLEAGGLERSDATEADDFAVTHVGRPFRDDMDSRGRWFGGSTNLWFGRIALPAPIDFEHRPWVPNSGWPLSFDDVAPWLTTATGILGLAHADKLDVHAWPDDPTIDTFASGAATDLAVWLWADGMYMGPTARRQLEDSANVRVVLDATVTELVTEAPSGPVQRVMVASPGGQRSVVATTYVLAAGGIENARLLLASRNASPAGVGNHHDNVGRYYLDHPNCEGAARIDLRAASPDARARLALFGDRRRRSFGDAQLRVTFTAATQRADSLLNHSSYFHDPTAAQLSRGYLAARDLRRTVVARRRPVARELLRDVGALMRDSPQLAAHAVRVARHRTVPAELVVVDQMEQEPDRESRIVLDSSRRDRFGIPRPVVDWRVGRGIYRSQRRMHELLRDQCRRIGVDTFQSSVLEGDEPDVDDMRHPSGTTRMTTTPADGVVDADCRVHGVENLYVSGSSVFPTAGHFNPTLLIVGLAARLADHLRRELTAPVTVAR